MSDERSGPPPEPRTPYYNLKVVALPDELVAVILSAADAGLLRGRDNT